MKSMSPRRFIYLNEDGVPSEVATAYDEQIDTTINPLDGMSDANLTDNLRTAMSRPDFPKHLTPIAVALLALLTPGANAEDISISLEPIMAGINPAMLAQSAGIVDWITDGVGIFQELLDYLSRIFGWDTKSLSEKIKTIVGGLAIIGTIEEYIRRTRAHLIKSGKKEIYHGNVNLGHIPAHPTTMSLENGKLTFILDTSAKGDEVLIDDVLESMNKGDVKAIRNAIKRKYKGEIKGKKEILDYDIFLDLPSDVLGRFLSTLKQLTTDLPALRQGLTSGENRKQNNGNGIIVIPVIEPGIKKNYTQDGITPQLVGTADKEFDTKIKLRRIEVSEREVRKLLTLFSSYYWHGGEAVQKDKFNEVAIKPQQTFLDVLEGNNQEALKYLFNKKFQPIQEIDLPRDYIDQARFTAVLKGGKELLKHDEYQVKTKKLDDDYNRIATSDIDPKEKMKKLKAAKKAISDFNTLKKGDPVRVGVANANPRPDGTDVDIDISISKTEIYS